MKKYLVTFDVRSLFYGEYEAALEVYAFNEVHAEDLITHIVSGSYCAIKNKKAKEISNEASTGVEC